MCKDLCGLGALSLSVHYYYLSSRVVIGMLDILVGETEHAFFASCQFLPF